MYDISADMVAQIVGDQLGSLSDATLAARIGALLVHPYRVDRESDYGEPGIAYPCWTVLEHRPSATGIAYCGHGFGPRYPWGLVFLTGDQMSIGMDYAWYAALVDAFRDSMAWNDGATR